MLSKPLIYIYFSRKIPNECQDFDLKTVVTIRTALLITDYSSYLKKKKKSLFIYDEKAASDAPKPSVYGLHNYINSIRGLLI